MSKNVSTFLNCLAVAAACLLWLPRETTLSFAGGIDTCDITGRKDRTCGSTGTGTCVISRQACFEGSNPLFLCEPLQGGQSECHGHQFCADEDNDATSSNCTPPGS